jgi:hypothetical protein
MEPRSPICKTAITHLLPLEGGPGQWGRQRPARSPAQVRLGMGGGRRGELVGVLTCDSDEGRWPNFDGNGGGRPRAWSGGGVWFRWCRAAAAS